jgi:hypothetical protein
MRALHPPYITVARHRVIEGDNRVTTTWLLRFSALEVCVTACATPARMDLQTRQSFSPGSDAFACKGRTMEMSDLQRSFTHHERVKAAHDNCAALIYDRRCDFENSPLTITCIPF